MHCRSTLKLLFHHLLAQLLKEDSTPRWKTSPFDGTIPTKMRSSFAQLRYSMSPSSLSVSVCSSPVSTKSSSSSNSESSPGRNDTQLPVSELTPSSSSTSIL
ncbi:hypothetical protein RvY_06362-2 [Ramazzottius varieornatus]|uniref:Uncharacterized protein n=1 Tax=Ramazzottius varieornatus TaxID=947166 RepID=A0A1D1UY97_RAMVA|nr:hypothetical protein RvY_06362-2 [Ramazzottius varieornatus]